MSDEINDRLDTLKCGEFRIEDPNNKWDLLDPLDKACIMIEACLEGRDIHQQHFTILLKFPDSACHTGSRVLGIGNAELTERIANALIERGVSLLNKFQATDRLLGNENGTRYNLIRGVMESAPGFIPKDPDRVLRNLAVERVEFCAADNDYAPILISLAVSRACSNLHLEKSLRNYEALSSMNGKNAMFPVAMLKKAPATAYQELMSMTLNERFSDQNKLFCFITQRSVYFKYIFKKLNIELSERFFYDISSCMDDKHREMFSAIITSREEAAEFEQVIAQQDALIKLIDDGYFLPLLNNPKPTNSSAHMPPIDQMIIKNVVMHSASHGLLGRLRDLLLPSLSKPGLNFPFARRALETLSDECPATGEQLLKSLPQGLQSAIMTQWLHGLNIDDGFVLDLAKTHVRLSLDGLFKLDSIVQLAASVVLRMTKGEVKKSAFNLVPLVMRDPRFEKVVIQAVVNSREGKALLDGTDIHPDNLKKLTPSQRTLLIRNDLNL